MRHNDAGCYELRRLHATGQLVVLGETGIQHRGHRADDPRYEPYFALAEELDIPVGLHLGEGAPSAARFPGYESYRVDVGQPLLLENLLRGLRGPDLDYWILRSVTNAASKIQLSKPGTGIRSSFQTFRCARARRTHARIWNTSDPA